MHRLCTVYLAVLASLSVSCPTRPWAIAPKGGSQMPIQLKLLPGIAALHLARGQLLDCVFNFDACMGRARTTEPGATGYSLVPAEQVASAQGTAALAPAARVTPTRSSKLGACHSPRSCWGRGAALPSELTNTSQCRAQCGACYSAWCFSAPVCGSAGCIPQQLEPPQWWSGITPCKMTRTLVTTCGRQFAKPDDAGQVHMAWQGKVGPE